MTNDRDCLHLLLVEDSTLLREGVRALLDRTGDLEVVADSGTLEGALQVLADPDVIVTDIWLKDGRSALVVSRLAERFPRAAVLVLTLIDDPVEVRAAFEAGARGYILKDASGPELAEAVRRVATGADYLHPALGASLARLRPGTAGASETLLSGREREVLRLIALGHTNAAIASFLNVSLRTVEAHRGRIYQKLALKTRADLVRYAAHHGLTSEP